MIRRALLMVMGSLMVVPSLLWAGGVAIPGFYGTIASTLPAVGANTVPVLKDIVQGVGSVTTTGGNFMTIKQTQPKAVIDWRRFNIGSNATVYFNQQGNATWAALNRIWDASPSQIFGTLKADGQVYLINQNGILFAPGSQVNVHTLVASSLNLDVDDWLKNTWSSTSANTTIFLAFADTNSGYKINGQPDSFYGSSATPGAVSNAGTIQTPASGGGSVFLIGPQVDNSGAIVTPSGQIGLVAGTSLELDSGGSSYEYPGGDTRTALIVKMDKSPPSGSTATNLAGGYLAADTGLVGMYGYIVNQDGVIRSVTAVQQGAHVELFASNTISTGPGSLIDVPVSTSSDKINSTFTTEQSSITLSGLDPTNPANPYVYPSLIEHYGSIIAPSGLVTMDAVNRVYLASGSTINVNGLWLDEPASAGLFSVQLNTYNLRDSFSQKGGLLQGATITMSQLAGSAIGDVSGAYTALDLSAEERHTAGGTVNINVTGSKGDIIERQGAVVDFSGGGITYAAGALDTTVLVSGTNIYSISAALPDITYNRILNVQTFTNSRFGITEEYDGVYYGGAFPVNKYVPQYTVGSNAGALTLQASTVALDGTLLGQATNGLQQTSASNPVNGTGNQSESGYIEATGGKLNITVTGGIASDPQGGSITLSSETTPLSPDFTPTNSKGNITPLPSNNTVLSAATLDNADLSTLTLAANTTITLARDTGITLAPGGAFNATARRIEDYGSVTVPGGSIGLTLATNTTSKGTSNYIPLDERIYLATGSSL
ncbi:MAG: filamentous hemagglutinin N-terminal domain-containing protein, partial [Syntrophorhabdales bacterium]